MKTPAALKTTLLFLAFVQTACAEADAGIPDLNASVVITAAVSAVLLFYSYLVRAENARLKNEIKKYKSKLAEYARAEEKPGPAGRGVEKAGMASADAKTNDAAGGMLEQYTKKLYWDRLPSTIKKVSSDGEELLSLQNKERDLEEVIELTKRKYIQREIDEKSFSEIIKEHQKQIIEVEAKISKIRKKEDEEERSIGPSTTD
jgi:hypothetical protein